MSERTIRVPLIRLCLARSGDKGDTANIGVIARSEAIYAWMLQHLTPAVHARGAVDVVGTSQLARCLIFDVGGGFQLVV